MQPLNDASTRRFLDPHKLSTAPIELSRLACMLMPKTDHLTHFNQLREMALLSVLQPLYLSARGRLLETSITHGTLTSFGGIRGRAAEECHDILATTARKARTWNIPLTVVLVALRRAIGRVDQSGVLQGFENCGSSRACFSHWQRS